MCTSIRGVKKGALKQVGSMHVIKLSYCVRRRGRTFCISERGNVKGGFVSGMHKTCFPRFKGNNSAPCAEINTRKRIEELCKTGGNRWCIA